MFEHHNQPLLPRRVFYRRVVRNLLIGGAFISVSLLGGMLGYHHLEKMSWLDAFLNAAMILAGMGPVGTLQTDAGKLFAGCYALYSGLALVAAVGIIFSPVIHRVLHKFHLEDTTD